MVRSVTDAAIVLSIIAGRDLADNYTLAQPEQVPDYTQALDKHALRGKRIGVPRILFADNNATHNHPSINDAFDASLDVLRALGATIVDPADVPSALELSLSQNETITLRVDFKIDLNNYFESLKEVPTGVRSMGDLIAWNDAHPDLEKPEGCEDQAGLYVSNATVVNQTYFDALAANHDLGSTRGIDYVLNHFGLDAIVLPANGWTTSLAAIVGYPIVTVPLGFHPDNITAVVRPPGSLLFPAPGIPFGLSFIGTKFSEYSLVSFAFAYEQATHTRLARKAFPAAIPKSQLHDVVKRRIGRGRAFY